MFFGKNKAITFSYDDGTVQDIRLIEIFNKYNLKATFNLNSELLGLSRTLLCDGIAVDHTKNNPEDVKHIYDGHEVAAHTLTHPYLPATPDDEVVRQIEEDRAKLSEIVGYEVRGMAYPCGEPNCDDRIAELVKNKTKIEYARRVNTTKSFEPFPDLYKFEGTLYHHGDWNILFEMGQKFIELETETPKIFYIWGHSFEFDIYPERWEKFEEFCKMISGHSDIFYGTNIEVLKGK